MSERIQTPSQEALDQTLDQAREATRAVGTHDTMIMRGGSEVIEFMGGQRMADPQLRVTENSDAHTIRTTGELRRGNKDYKAIVETDESASQRGEDYHRVRVTTHNEDGTKTERVSKNPYLARLVATSIGNRVVEQATAQAETKKAA